MYRDRLIESGNRFDAVTEAYTKDWKIDRSWSMRRRLLGETSRRFCRISCKNRSTKIREMVVKIRK